VSAWRDRLEGQEVADQVVTAQADAGMSADRIDASAERVLGARFEKPTKESDAFWSGYDETAATYAADLRDLGREDQAIRDGDAVRVTRHVIAPDGSERQVADWTGTARSPSYEDGALTGLELTREDGGSSLSARDQPIGREGTLRTSVTRVQADRGGQPGAIPREHAARVIRGLDIVPGRQAEADMEAGS
jgi:hypothetical protein